MGILTSCSDPPHPQVNKCLRDPVFKGTIVTKSVTGGQYFDYSVTG